MLCFILFPVCAVSMPANSRFHCDGSIQKKKKKKKKGLFAYGFLARALKSSLFGLDAQSILLESRWITSVLFATCCFWSYAGRLYILCSATKKPRKGGWRSSTL